VAEPPAGTRVDGDVQLELPEVLTLTWVSVSPVLVMVKTSVICVPGATTVPDGWLESTSIVISAAVVTTTAGGGVGVGCGGVGVGCGGVGVGCDGVGVGCGGVGVGCGGVGVACGGV